MVNAGELKERQAELAAANADLASASAELATAKAELANRTEQHAGRESNLQGQVAELQTQKSQLEAQLSGLQSEKQDLEKQHADTLAKLLSEAEKDAAARKIEREHLQRERAAAVASMEALLDQLRAEKDDAWKRLAAVGDIAKSSIAHEQKYSDKEADKAALAEEHAASMGAMQKELDQVRAGIHLLEFIVKPFCG